jgi:hypothetical protein
MCINDDTDAATHDEQRRWIQQFLEQYYGFELSSMEGRYSKCPVMRDSSIPRVNLTAHAELLKSRLPVQKQNDLVAATLAGLEEGHVGVRAGSRGMGAETLRAGNAIRMASFNIERGWRWREQCELMKAHALSGGAPHLVFLNEVDGGMARSGNEDVAWELAKCLGMPAGSGGVGARRSSARRA